MGIQRTFLCAILLSLLSISASATNHYILDGGSGDGSSWSSALDDLPSTFVRGDTYYVGDGTYGGHTFSTAASGDSVITIKKATVAAHGTETGWDSAYGDGQAVFTGDPVDYQPLMSFNTDYWVFDGVTRNESDWADTTSYGFRLRITENSTYHNKIVIIWNGSDNITIQYCDMQQAGMQTNLKQDGILCFEDEDSGAVNITITRNYIHHINRTGILFRYFNNVDISYNEIAYIDDYSNPYIHREAIAFGYDGDNATVRYNKFHDIIGRPGNPGASVTCVIGFLDSNNTFDDFYIYGNIFGDTFSANGIIGCDAGTTVNDCLIYNNTFVDADGLDGQSIGFFFENGTGNEAKNNVWYGESNTPEFTNITTDYNAWAGNSETNGVSLTSNPFVTGTYVPDVGSQLIDAADTTVSSAYRTDMNAITHNEIGALVGAIPMTATVIDTLSDGADDGYVPVGYAEWVTWGWTQRIFMGNYGAYIANANLRMQLPDVPQGATITNATLYMQHETNRSGDNRVVWSAWKTDNAAAISDSTTLRTALNNNTTAIVDTTITNLVEDQDILIDVTDIVQEMVDLAYWDPGDHIVFLADGSYASAYRIWYIEDSTNPDGNQAKLTVSYEY